MKKYIFIFFGIIPICLFAQNKSNNFARVFYLYNSAYSDFNREFFSRSLQSVNELLEIDSSNTKALILKARIYNRYLGQPLASVKFIDKALAVDNKNLMLLKYKVDFLLRANKVQEAASVLESIDTRYYDEETIFLYTNVMIASKNTEAYRFARELLKMQIIDNGESIPLMRQLAAVFLLTNKDSALFWYKRCIDVRSKEQVGYDNLVTAYLSMNNIDEAKKTLDLGISNCIQKDLLYFSYSRIYFDIEKKDSLALEYINNAINENISEDYLIYRAEIYDTIGRGDLAYIDYLSLLKEKPWKADYLKNVASREFDSGLYDQTINTIENSALFDTSLLDTCASLLFKSYFVLGKFEKSYEFIDRQGVISTFDFYDAYIRAMLLATYDRFNESLDLLKQIENQKESLNQEQVFNLLVLKGLLYFALEDYVLSYKIFDELYLKYGNNFLSAFRTKLIPESERSTKRKIVLEFLGDEKFSIYVNMTTLEYKSLKIKYNLPSPCSDESASK